MDLVLSYFPGNVASPSYLKNPPFTANYGPVVSTASSNGPPNVLLSRGLPPLQNNSIDNQSGALIATALDFQSNRIQQFNLLLEKEFAVNGRSARYGTPRNCHRTSGRWRGGSTRPRCVGLQLS